MGGDLLLYARDRLTSDNPNMNNSVRNVDPQLSVYALIETGRKYSSAHYFTNGTLIILGGIEPNINITTTHIEPSTSIISLFLDSKKLSLTSITTNASSLIQPISGHTSHYNSSSDSIFSVFGTHPNQQYSPPIQPYSLSSLSSPSLPPVLYNNQKEDKPSTTGRQQHTSVYINSTLYVFGGYHIQNQQKTQFNESLIIYANQTSRTVSFPSISGHSTITFRQWIISCFGNQDQSPNDHCIWFDTLSFSITNASATVLEKPAARTHASMISIKNNHYLLYGGETNESGELDDIWELIITQPFDMMWRKIKDHSKGKKSSGHVGVLLSNDTVLYYGGSGVNEENTFRFFNTTSMNWIETNTKMAPMYVKRAEVTSPSSSTSLGAGAIVGIVIGILVFLGIIFLFLRRRNQKRVLAPSRATQFQPQIPLQKPIVKENPALLEQQQLEQQLEQQQEQRQQQKQQQQKQQQQFVLSLPEIALSSDSRLSLGPNFGYLTESNKSDTSLYSNNGSKLRTSSVYPARKSYLFPPPTPRTPDSTFSNSVRGSISAKSVSSVQWVGFNDNMDYSTNEFNLSVANRASNYYSDSSAQTTPRSPMFPNYLKDNYERHI